MKVCVIGGGGFIGQWVVRRLLARGDSVIVVGRSQRPPGLPAEIDYVVAEYGTDKVLGELMERVESIIHLAYATVPSTSFSDPIFDLMANVPSSVALFQQAAKVGIKRLVLVSSGGTVYGDAETLPIREDAPTNPISPYGITKLTIERYAHMYHTLMGLPVVTMRPGNAYGVRCEGRPGGGFVTAAVKSAVSGAPLHIFGDGSAIRDYIHVSDVAAGIVAGLVDGVPGDIYNIGTGVGLSNIDIVRLVRTVLGLKQDQIEIQYEPFRGFDVAANVLDSSQLAEVSDWKPTVSIKAGIEELWKACALQSIV
jgi:UDP-glucose 4-epimerase